MMIDDSYFMELCKAIRESSGQDKNNNKTTKKAGPRRLAQAQPQKYKVFASRMPLECL